MDERDQDAQDHRRVDVPTLEWAVVQVRREQKGKGEGENRSHSDMGLSREPLRWPLTRFHGLGLGPI